MIRKFHIGKGFGHGHVRLGQSPSTLEPAADLREALIAAFCAQQYDVMAQLINANVAAIRESFPEWTTVPDEIRNDPEALERYAQTLFTIASMFEGSGDGSLMTPQARGGQPDGRMGYRRCSRRKR